MSDKNSDIAVLAAEREKTIVITSIIGIVTNLFLVGFKAFVGLVSNSIAVILDAVNNLSDALSSVVTIIGEKLVLDSMRKGKELGFGILQFNAVVESNTHARHLYERLGFTQLGTIPNGFRMKDGHFENICPYYIEL